MRDFLNNFLRDFVGKSGISFKDSEVLKKKIWSLNSFSSIIKVYKIKSRVVGPLMFRLGGRWVQFFVDFDQYCQNHGFHSKWSVTVLCSSSSGCFQMEYSEGYRKVSVIWKLYLKTWIKQKKV